MTRLLTFLSPLMDSLTSTFNGGICRYFWRRKYHRLYGGGGEGRQRRSEATTFGGGPDYDNRCSNLTRRRMFWKIKTVPRVIVRTFWSALAKLLTRLRNACLNMMINLVGNNGALNTINIFGRNRIPRAREAGPVQVYSFNEVENRIVLEICKALKAHRAEGLFLNV